MSAPHFFVDVAGPLEPGRRVTLRAEDSNHALRALRMKHGDGVTVSDDAGLVGNGHLVDEQDGQAVVELDEVRRVVRRGTLVSVALAPPKGDRLGWAVQKLGELGVDEIVLLLARRSVREWRPDRADRAVQRLLTVAREAAMQSRQPFVTRVVEPRPYEELVGSRRTMTVVLDPNATARLSACLPEDATAVRLMVGPEGGFAEDELDRAREAGAATASLGEQILRTETAAVVGASLVLHRYGRLG
jgi:16S rRNA (uracil1498-N3)-methyltransferase